MSDGNRPRRPPMRRTGPERAWSGVFGPPADIGPQPADAGQVSREATDDTHARSSASSSNDANRDAQRDGAASASGAGGLEDAITRSVEIGYRVVDDYLRQGREVASNLRSGQATPESIVRDTSDLATRMMRYASDFVGTWLELFEIAAARGNDGTAAEARPRATHAASSNGTSAADTTSTPSPAPARTEPARVDLVVVTRRPVEASVRLEERDVTRLRVHALRCADASIARLTNVEVCEGGGATPPLIRVTIPDEQPPGTYEGLILDDARNLPVGVLRVTIRD